MQDNSIFHDLKHKTKTVNDLIRFIGNRTEDLPMFSLLLGSGCSISSGIKSGGDLIRQWKKEIQDEITDNQTPRNPDDFENYLEKLPWYDPRNEYASLFEHRYDLQSQRRAFLERLIKDAKPSIGYAYLTKLIEANYFNTIFTTNFDDLINEAFYLYSTKRPIVCAHDSAISSVAVTSSRPKIIKLHGDYLFENLKNTLRETESLEDNMKDKFMEFAKDFGLIVIGYSGCDRSIMDILTIMIRNNDYFKNGIYWCLPKNTKEVNSELKKLLWSDRVYIVEIDGFDELMAQINSILNKEMLPINSETLSKKHQHNLIDNLISNEIVKQSDSPIILRDIKRLQEELKKNTVRDFLDLAYSGKSGKKEIQKHTERKGPLVGLDDEEQIEVDGIKLLIEKGDLEDALNKVVNNESKANSNRLKSAYLYLHLVILQRQGVRDNQRYFPILQQLNNLNPNYEDFYLDLSYRSENVDDKLRYIDEALKVFPNDAFLYLTKARILRHFFGNLAVRNEEKDEKIIETYSASIKLDTTITNNAWLELCEFYAKYYSNNIDKRNKKIESIFLRHEENDKFEPSVLKVKKLISDEDSQEWGNLLREAFDWTKKADYSNRSEECLMLYTDWLFYHDDSEKAWSLIQEFEEQFVASDKLLRHKAFWKVYHEEDLDGAISIIESLISDMSSERFLLMRLYAIKNNQEKLEDIHKKYDDEETTLEYYSVTDQAENYCSYIDTNYIDVDKPITENILIMYTYFSIMAERYERGYSLAKKYIQIPSCQKNLWINYFILESRYKRKPIDETKLKEKILNRKAFLGDDVLAAAYGLIGDSSNAVSHINKYLKNHAISKYTIQKWPAFEKIRDDHKFKKSVGIE